MLSQQLVNGLVLGCMYALIALGYTLIFGIIRVIFFAQGELSMVGAFVALGCFNLLLGRPGIPQSPLFLISAALLAGAVVASLAGVISERLALRPLRQAHRTKQLIASLGVSIVLQNLVFLGVSSESKPVPQVIPLQQLQIGGATITSLQLTIIGLALALMLALEYTVRRTSLGIAIRAVAENPDHASLAGINVHRTVRLTFIIGSVLAASAGVMMSLYDGVVRYDMGFLPGIKGFTAAILGGIGNVRGGMIGGLVLGLVEVLGAGFVSSENRHLFAFATLVAVLTFRPSGILGEAAGR